MPYFSNMLILLVRVEDAYSILVVGSMDGLGMNWTLLLALCNNLTLHK